MISLTTSDENLGQHPGSPLDVYFKLKIPEGQTQGDYLLIQLIKDLEKTFRGRVEFGYLDADNIHTRRSNH